LLADADVEKAGRAVFAMAESPTDALAILRAHVKSVSVTVESIDKLVGDLDHPRFAEREKAAKELGMLGRMTESALKKKLASKPSPEVTMRIEKLLADFKSVRPTVDQLRESRAVEILERIGTNQATDFLRKLASGTEGAPLTRLATEAVNRVVRRTPK
jgi:hypothetical protein